MTCPLCGNTCGRDEVHNGVAMLYGPYGCGYCGWSEYEEYDRSNGTSLAEKEAGVRVDQWGGMYPTTDG